MPTPEQLARLGYEVEGSGDDWAVIRVDGVIRLVNTAPIPEWEMEIGNSTNTWQEYGLWRVPNAN